MLAEPELSKRHVISTQSYHFFDGRCFFMLFVCHGWNGQKAGWTSQRNQPDTMEQPRRRAGAGPVRNDAAESISPLKERANACVPLRNVWTRTVR